MLEVVTSLARWRERTEELRAVGTSLGLTMTMGALHAGHVALLEQSASQCGASLATVFVNPLQFNDPADFERYGVDLDADVALAERVGVRAVLAPDIREMWPRWPAPTPTSVHVAGLTDRFEGADRPGHFDGVATVVTKVLVATGPCRAYFGEKDYQQLCVVRQLVEDLGLPADVIGCATVHEPDGVALSSRNARLSSRGRRAAVALSRALAEGCAAAARGEGIASIEATMRDVVAEEPDVGLAYASVVEPATLRAPADPSAGTAVRLLIAGVVEGIRLIDNAAAVLGPVA